MGKQLKYLNNQDEKQNKSTNIQTILELQNCLNVLFNNEKQLLTLHKSGILLNWNTGTLFS